MKRYTRVNPITAERRKEKKEYSTKLVDYLMRHPYCQITIARYGINESDILELANRYGKFGPIRWSHSDGNGGAVTIIIPRANQIHHRNKNRGARLLDERFWLSASNEAHNWTEAHLSEARELGISLPFQADDEGRWGTGNQAKTTPELMKGKDA